MIGPSFMLIIVLLCGTAFCLAYRKRWIFANRPGMFLPQTAPSASRTSRIIESTVLFSVGIVVLSAMATKEHSGGYLLNLGQLVPECARFYEIAFACACFGVSCAILTALCGRTFLGAITMGVVLIAYGIVLDRSSYSDGAFISENSIKPVVNLTISVGRMDGAEIWVNGVCLGKSPYTTTLEEFKAKVPIWSEPPTHYKKDTVTIPEYGHDQNGMSSSIPRRWCKMQLPQIPIIGSPPKFKSNKDAKDYDEKNRLAEEYYFRVRYAGEWGVHGGGGTGGCSGLGQFIYNAQCELDFFFPERQKRLETLLNKARIASYQVDAEWFKTIDTYDDDGWKALSKAIDKEPEMAKLMDGWAVWRYKLDKITDEESAWQVFLGICNEADAKCQYSTASPAGRAVELLVPKLPQDRLIDKAVKIIRGSYALAYTYQTENGRLQFGYNACNGTRSGYSFGAKMFPFSGFPVAHAVWKLSDKLQADNAPSPNVIQERIVPEIIRYNCNTNNEGPMLIAAYFGGPVIDKFLMRHRWETDANYLPYDEKIYSSGTFINKWLYMLAYLNDEAGREFRRKNADSIMQLADKFCNNLFFNWDNQIGFIFKDQSIAKEFWPRFVNLIRNKPSNSKLETQWLYLLKMGAAAKPEMFVEAWKNTNVDQADRSWAFPLLDRLDRDKRKEVVDALVEDIKTNTKHSKHILDGFHLSQDQLIQELQYHIPIYEAEGLFAELHRDLKSKPDWFLTKISLYLKQPDPDLPLVEMLAKDENPKLRQMVLEAALAYPIPKNQEMLQQLLIDPDSTVREGAKKVSQELKVLAQADLRQYASDYSPAAEKASPAE